MIKNMNFAPSLKNDQKGVSSVLVLVLTGLGLSAVVMGAIYSIRSAQAQSIAVHAQTQAQMRAWTGLEVARQYFAQQGLNVAANVAPFALTLGGGLAGVALNVTAIANPDVANCGAGFARVDVQAVGTSGAQNTNNAAVARLEASYCVNGAPAVPPDNKLVANLKGDVDLSGGFVIGGVSGGKFVVDGNVTTGGSTQGFDLLYSTGTMTLNSAGVGAQGTVASEGNMTISNTGTYGYIKTMGNLSVTNPVSVQTAVVVNKLLSITGSGGLDGITGGASATFDVGATATLPSTTLSIGTWNNNKAASVNVRGNSNVTNFAVSGAVKAIGNYSGNSSSAGVGSCATGTANVTNVTPSSAACSPTVAQMTASAMTMPKIDAYAYKSLANYVVSYAGGAIKVNVKNVPDFVGSSGVDYTYSYNSTTGAGSLCHPVTGVCKVVLVNGSSGGLVYQSGGLVYDATAGNLVYSATGYNGGVFTLYNSDGAMNSNLAPGIWWFDGDLVLNQGTYHGVFIAKGNVSASTVHVYAPNWVGATGLSTVTNSGMCNPTNFPTLIPNTFCNGSTFIKIPVGNDAFFVGSYDPSTGTFNNRSGDIDFGSSSVVYGNVVTADHMHTTGAALIHGFLTAAHQSGSATDRNKFAAGTRIDMTGAPGTVDPGDNGGGNAIPAAALMRWIRYQ